MNGAWTLIVCGCGTANYWAVPVLVRSVAARRLARLVLIDRARTRPENAITCPRYREAGRPKSVRLAELVRESLAGDVKPEAVHGYVERVDWDAVCRGPHPTIVLVGLDAWPARLAVVEGVRLRRAAADAGVAVIQIGLDRGRAAVGVFGSRLLDPCPACGLGALPEPEPCVVASRTGAPRRGTLRSESLAAARVARQVVESIVGGGSAPRGFEGWINTKTNLLAPETGGRRFRRFTRSCRAMPGCLGPHAPARPLRWDELLSPAAAAVPTEIGTP